MCFGDSLLVVGIEVTFLNELQNNCTTLKDSEDVDSASGKSPAAAMLSVAKAG